MSGSAFDLDDTDLIVVPVEAGDDFDDLLAGPASAVTLRLPDFDPEAMAEATIELLEAFAKKQFDEAKHPRWPKGTPKAGRFMLAGESFVADGKRWQILTITGNVVHAAEASGDVAKVEHRDFPATQALDGGKAVPKVKEAEPKRLKGGANTSDADFPVNLPGGENTTVVSPYVRPETHDPKITIPAGSKLNAGEWKRFGNTDQAYYTHLMERFGPWDPSEAKNTMKAAWASYGASVKSTINESLEKQYGPGYWGSSYEGGRALNLAWLFAHKNKGAALKTAWEQYEMTKVAFDELNEVVHWDLYNRTRSPDITLFHGGKGTGYQDNYIAGKTPIYAGYSQSYSLNGAEGWGDHILATPVAIPYVSLSVYTPVPGHEGMSGEKEIAVGVRMKLDGRSVTFNSQSMGMSGGYAAAAEVRKWLQSKTKLQPAGGWIVDDLKDIWAGKSSIPLPEEPLSLVHVNKISGQESWTVPPTSIQAEAKGMVKTLKYKSEDGSKEAAIGILDTMGLKPGDFIEGKQGARYLIVSDNADPHGLRYVKVMSSSGTIVSDFSTSFGFEASQGNEFYRLDGHIDLPQPKPVKGWTPWTDAQYNALSKGEKKQLNKVSLDGLFTYDNEIYKVIGAQSGGQIEVQSMQNGEKYKGNSLGVIVEMVPTSKFKPPQEFKAGDKVVFSSGEGHSALADVLSVDDKADAVEVQWGLGKLTIPTQQVAHAPDLPGVATVQKGDRFAFNGKGPYTVTTVLKSGTVKAKLSGGSVLAFSAMDLNDSTVVYRPSTFAFGDKAKLKDLPIGTVVSGSPKVVRPYLVEGHVGTKVYLRNLETGEFSGVSKNKSYPRLLTAAEIQAQKEAVPPPTATKPSNTVFNPDDYAPGGKVKLSELAVGDVFKGTSTGAIYKITGDKTDSTHFPVVVLSSGSSGKEVGYPQNFNSTTQVIALTAKAQVPSVPGAKPKVGSTIQIGSAQPADIIEPKAGLFGGKKLMVVGPSDGGASLSFVDAKMINAAGVPNPQSVQIATSGEATYHGVYTGASWAEPVEIDPAKLKIAEIDFYKWHKSGGGGYTYPKLKSMAVGTVFTDKADKAWKVKQSGVGGVVVTDGTDLFQADGDWRGKVDDGTVAFVDNTKLPGNEDTTGKVVVGELGIGDEFEIPPGYNGGGDLHAVTGKKVWHEGIALGPGYWTTTTNNLSKGKVDEVAASLVPVNVKQSAPAVAVGDKFHAKDVFPTMGDMPEGLQFTLGADTMGGGVVYTVEPKNAAGDVVVSWVTAGGKDYTTYAADTPMAGTWDMTVTGLSGAASPVATSITSANDLAALPVGASATVGDVVVTHLPKGAGKNWLIEKPGHPPLATAGSLYAFGFVSGQKPWPAKGPMLPNGANMVALHGSKLAVSAPVSTSGLASGKLLGDVIKTKGEIPDGAVVSAGSNEYSVKNDGAEVTLTILGKGNNGGSYKYLASDPVPKHWKLESLPAEPTPEPVAGAAGQNLKDTFGTWGNVPEGTTFKADTPTVYTITKDGNDTVLNWTKANGSEVKKAYSPGDEINYKDYTILSVGGGAREPKQEAPPVQPDVFFEAKGDGGKVNVSDMAEFEFGKTMTGKVVYKGNNGKLYAVGKQKPSTVKKVTPVQWVGPSPDVELGDLIPDGDEKPLKELEPGTYFQHGANTFMVIGQGPDGTTGQHVGAWKYVAFDASNPTVQPMVLPAVLPETTAPVEMDSKDLQPGDVFTISSPEGNSGAKFQFISHAGGGENAQLKVINPSTDASVAKAGDVIPWGSSPTTTPDITVFKHGNEPVTSPPGWSVGDQFKHASGPTYEVKSVEADGSVGIGAEGPGGATYTYTPTQVQGFLDSGTWTVVAAPEPNPLPAGITPGMLVGDGFAENGPAEVIGMGTGGLHNHVLIKYTSGPLKGTEGAITPSEIVPAPAALPEADYGPFKIGQKVKNQYGDVFTVARVPALNPNSYEGLVPVVDDTGTPSGYTVSHLTLVPEPKGGDPTAVSSPLQPYKYHKSGGGGYSYPKLGTLEPGTVFTDKTKTKYMVVAHEGDQTIFGQPDSTAMYSAPSKSFVHKLADPTEVQEGKLIYLTSGRVALVAA